VWGKRGKGSTEGALERSDSKGREGPAEGGSSERDICKYTREFLTRLKRPNRTGLDCLERLPTVRGSSREEYKNLKRVLLGKLSDGGGAGGNREGGRQ